MNTHTNKTQKQTNQIVRGTKQLKKNNLNFQFIDNRPEALAQRKLQEMANNSPQAKQLKAFQEMANNSPQAKQLKAFQEMANNSPQAKQLKAFQKMADKYNSQQFSIQKKQTIHINDDKSLEEEANVMGAKALQSVYPQLDSTTQRKKSQLSSPKADGETAQLMKFYHGTDLETANILLKAKIDARGKGELGGGFYMTHDAYQAAHIGDYYTGKEGRGTQWGVVEFDVDDDLLDTMKLTAFAPGEEFDEYYKKVKEEGNTKESKFDWSLSPIKDGKTPYPQHLFAQGGLKILNDKTTTRKLVLAGKVGIDKALYAKGIAGYEMEDDDILDNLLERADDSEEVIEEMEEKKVEKHTDDSSEEDDSEYYRERVAKAIKQKAPRLTKSVIKELNEDLLDEDDDLYNELKGLLKKAGIWED